MSKIKDVSGKERQRKTIIKLTSQGGSKPKTSSMNKHQRRAFKFYRGQGK